MDDVTPTTIRRWHALGDTVRGANHVRSNLPNQDALRTSMPTEHELPAILVVSDGHGSEKCFRSDHGARLAAEVAIELLGRIASAEGAPEKNDVEYRLPKEISALWRERVQLHLADQPFSEEELRLLSSAVRDKLAANDSEAVLTPYGATLVAAIVHERYVVCLQLGDGEILVVSAKTSQVERPLLEDDSLLANETTSLCQSDCAKKFRTRLQIIVDSPPPLILLSTDGYPNSFQTPSDFERVATDLQNLLDRDGVEAIKPQLTGWLEQASQEGSGDDVTLAILYREKGIEELPAVDQETIEASPRKDEPKQTGFLRQWLFVHPRNWFGRNPTVGLLSAVMATVLLIYSTLLSLQYFGGEQSSP